MKFPRLVYKSESVHLLVEDQDELESAVLSGWFETVPDALQGAVSVNNVPEVKAAAEKPVKTLKTSIKPASNWVK